MRSASAPPRRAQIRKQDAEQERFHEAAEKGRIVLDTRGETRAGSSTETRMLAVDGASARLRFDRLATEEPLEIRLRAGTETRTVAITMRTPGNDFELAAGFLYGEGVIGGAADVGRISYCVDVPAEQQYNTVNVDLTLSALPALDTLERHFTMTSACGVCGKANLDALRLRGVETIASEARVDVATILSLPRRLRAAQGIFEKTGGLHAAALFDLSGELLVLREDVGRHNAMDKLVGWALLQKRLPLDGRIVMVSGRSSYELVQKAASARIPVMCSVSAPSSLAVDVARTFGLTLVGFLDDSRFNVYANEERLQLEVRAT
jgi:FdhD protein